MILVLEHLPRRSRLEASFESYLIHLPDVRAEFSVLFEFWACHFRFQKQDFLLPGHPMSLDHLEVPEQNGQKDCFEVSHQPEMG